MIVRSILTWLALALGGSGCELTLVVRSLDATAPAAKPAPAPKAKPVAHTGHFTVSYVDAVHPTVASATTRGGLAAFDWPSIDATFRAYTLGESAIEELGFSRVLVGEDLPIAFVQETGPSGAPIVQTIRHPGSAEQVWTEVTVLRRMP
jgi:hypothetical protein